MMNEEIAKEIMDQIDGLTIEEFEEGWDWTYRKRTSSDCYCETALDAFIDFTKAVLAANDKLTGGDISYDNYIWLKSERLILHFSRLK